MCVCWRNDCLQFNTSASLMNRSLSNFHNRSKGFLTSSVEPKISLTINQRNQPTQNIINHRLVYNRTNTNEWCCDFKVNAVIFIESDTWLCFYKNFVSSPTRNKIAGRIPPTKKKKDEGKKLNSRWRYIGNSLSDLKVLWNDKCYQSNFLPSFKCSLWLYIFVMALQAMFVCWFVYFSNRLT